MSYRIYLLLCLLLTGCATSRSARQLALETAAAAQALDAALSGQMATARAAATEREMRIREQLMSFADQQAELQLQLELDEVVKNDFNRLRSFVDTQETTRQKLLATAATQLKALGDARQELRSPSEQLRSVSDNLIALSQPESRRQRVSSSLQFASDIAKRVKDSAEAAKKAAADAQPAPQQTVDPEN